MNVRGKLIDKLKKPQKSDVNFGYMTKITSEQSVVATKMEESQAFLQDFPRKYEARN